MSSDRPKLGSVFGAAAPDRSANLAGLLDSPAGVPSPASAPAPEPASAPEPAVDLPSAEAQTPTRPRGKTPRVSQPTASGPNDAEIQSSPHLQSGTNRVVPVVLDASVLSDLREFAARTDQTQGSVALRAIEAHADDLARYWRSSAAAARSGPGRLFGSTSLLHRRTEPGVQTQLRISVGDATTLDQLANDWAAPSRSALVNEALRRYVRPSEASAPRSPAR
jgi:hypothetical protein